LLTGSAAFSRAVLKGHPEPKLEASAPVSKAESFAYRS
jgi:hypothetical protein